MINRGFVSPEFRQRVRGIAVPIALAMGRVGLTPNSLTLIGFLGTCVAAVAAALEAWVLAGVLVIAFGIFDMFDGALARATGRASRFGAFLDSTLDRTGENLVLVGVGVGCAAAGFLPGVALAGTAVAFASVVTYTRAKAEALGLHGEVGYAPRPERLVLLSVGLVLAGLLGGLRNDLDGLLLASQVDALRAEAAWSLGIALGLISVLSAVTVAQRILHVRHQLAAIDQPVKEL